MSNHLINDTEQALRSARQLQERFERDPYRPRFHFLPPGGWLNDPNGALYWHGRYHLFYQYYPEAAYSIIEHRDGSNEHLGICWGHASSSDLIHWAHHPIALQPSIPGVDALSCFSGHVVDNGGVATIIYFGRPGGSCIATSSDYRLDRWTKHPRAVIPRPRPGEPDHGRYSGGDPCMWREGDRWYALCGFRSPQGGDTASLFRSHDTLHWEFVHDFYQSRREWTSVRDDCAVPDFFPLGDTHMLLCMSHHTGAHYYLGGWRNETFYPEAHGNMNWAGGQLNAPKSMLDGNGRRLMWGWVCEARTRDAQRAAGWAGMLSLPRVLSLSARGGLLMEPPVELQALRRHHRRRTDIRLAGGTDQPIAEISGDCLELAVELDPGAAGEVGVRVRCAPDGSEHTSICYRAAAGELVIDGSASSRRDDLLQPWPHPWAALFSDPVRELPTTEQVYVQRAPLALQPREPLKLRVFVDRSVVEVFANDRQCMTQRIYPARRDSRGVALFSHGGSARCAALDAWDMD
jgi:beta-fructofuranosidase